MIPEEGPLSEEWDHPSPVYGYDPGTLAVQQELVPNKIPVLWEVRREDFRFQLRKGRQTLWVLVHWPEGGGLAMRTTYFPDAAYDIDEERSEDGTYSYRLSSAMGSYRLSIGFLDPEKALIRWTVWITPSADLLLSEWPHDLYALDERGDPVPTEGIIHAAQRGSAAAVMYFSLTKPRSGSALYLQNLTSLNDYCRLTKTVPNTVVGDTWPHMGNVPPRSSQHPIPKGTEVILCDALARLSPVIPENERQSAEVFLRMLAELYPYLDPPETRYHDWTSRAERTVRDLETSPKARMPDGEELLVRPYVAFEDPDSMTQLTLLLAVEDYRDWLGEDVPLFEKLRQGVPNFYDHRLKTLRRYLPTVDDTKDRQEVDAWYLYHPLTNLARLAKGGDLEARSLFLGSLEFGIGVARRFKYHWPVQYDMETLQIIKRTRKPGELGQTDVGGLYAYVMLQAHDLTGEMRYLDEARLAVEALRGCRFSLGYQFNNTAWGANACLRLWKETGDEAFREQSYVFLASFFHNTFLWDSRLGPAEHYPTFLGVTCLHDGNYMAMYEEYEAFAAFHEYLSLCDGDLPPYVELLLTEYCRHLLDRGWYYYPGELPPDALSPEVRNGHIDPALSFPLEDLSVDGEPAGAVGQEIYGAGAPLAFVARAYHRLRDAPFLLYCDYPLASIEEGANSLTVGVRGLMSARLRLLPKASGGLPRVKVEQHHGKGTKTLRGAETPEGHLEYVVQGGSHLEVTWGESSL